MLRLFDADPLSAPGDLVEVFEEEIETARAWREYGKNNPRPEGAEAHHVWQAGGPGYSPAQQTLGVLSDAQYGAAKMLAMPHGEVAITLSTTYGVTFAEHDRVHQRLAAGARHRCRPLEVMTHHRRYKVRTTPSR